MEEDGLVVFFADSVDGLHNGVGRHHMDPAGMELQALQLQIPEGMLQLLRRFGIPGIHGSKADELVRGHIHQFFDLFIGNEAAHASGIILRQQAKLVQTCAAHLIEDMLQGCGTVFVDIQRFVTKVFPGRVFVDGFIKRRMNMNINKHPKPLSYMPTWAIIARTLSIARFAYILGSLM